jgi:hypothetical protein
MPSFEGYHSTPLLYTHALEHSAGLFLALHRPAFTPPSTGKTLLLLI